MKRISSTSGGGNKGSENTKFNNALAKDSSEPGESEVLWIQQEAGGCIIFAFMDNELVNMLHLKGGWAPNISFRFHISHRPNRGLIHVKGWEEGKLLFYQEIWDKSNASLKGGRLGVFTYSQPKAKWSALKYRF